MSAHDDAINDPSLKSIAFDRTTDWSGLYGGLASLGSTDGTTRRGRGYGLERLIYNKLLAEQDASVQASFRTHGDQIDGAAILDSRHLLFECKWEASPISGPILGQFQAKVDRRLIGTVGFFFSASGFSDAAPEYLARHHTLNTLLVDREDLDYVFKDGGSLSKLLREKLNKAAFSALIYWRRADAAAAKDAGRDPRALLVVVEGPHDALVLSALVEQLSVETQRTLAVKVLPGYGVAQANALVDALEREAPESRILVVLDGEDDGRDALWAWNQLNPGRSILIARPTIGEWLVAAGAEDDSNMLKFVEEVLNTSDRASLPDEQDLREVVRKVANNRE